MYVLMDKETMWSFFQKKKIKCPDGSVRFVYRNIDQAFPIHLRDVQSSLSAKLGVDGLAEGAAENKYASDVKALLFHIDETNKSLMLEFRSAYIAYEIHPCANWEKFDSSVREIRSVAQRTAQLKIKVRLMIECMKEGGASKQSTIDMVLREISASHPTISLPSAASSEMASARVLAEELSRRD